MSAAASRTFSLWSSTASTPCLLRRPINTTTTTTALQHRSISTRRSSSSSSSSSPSKPASTQAASSPSNPSNSRQRASTTSTTPKTASQRRASANQLLLNARHVDAPRISVTPSTNSHPFAWNSFFSEHRPLVVAVQNLPRRNPQSMTGAFGTSMSTPAHVSPGYMADGIDVSRSMQESMLRSQPLHDDFAWAFHDEHQTENTTEQTQVQQQPSWSWESYVAAYNDEHAKLFGGFTPYAPPPPPLVAEELSPVRRLLTPEEAERNAGTNETEEMGAVGGGSSINTPTGQMTGEDASALLERFFAQQTQKPSHLQNQQQQPPQQHQQQQSHQPMPAPSSVPIGVDAMVDGIPTEEKTRMITELFDALTIDGSLASLYSPAPSVSSSTTLLQGRGRKIKQSKVTIQVQDNVTAPAGSDATVYHTLNLVKIRRKKMNKHKWKKLRRRNRNSVRYNKSKRRRNREKLREEYKELGLEWK
ncbi:hypothetical protein HK102_001164 [Quaeritorhiza haematococci]|nr:hypothetical protein HK102_001164 [Quaeritorhiza haematococci]